MEKKQLIQVLKLLNLSLILLLLAVSLLVMLAFEYQEINKPQQDVFFCGTCSQIQAFNAQMDSTQLLGKAIFEANCLACHAATTEIVVGPGLQGITERRKEVWLLKWIKNPKKVLKSGDKYANTLFVKYNRAEMNAFPQLSNKDIKAVLAYLKMY